LSIAEQRAVGFIPAWSLASLHGEDQNVIQIDHHNTFCYEVPEDVIHHGLEGGRTISYSKEHYQGFEQASIGLEGCLPLVSRLNTNIVETPTDV